jgi:hypothetical protein
MRKIKRRTRDSKDEWKKVRLKLEDEGKRWHKANTPRRSLFKKL